MFLKSAQFKQSFAIFIFLFATLGLMAQMVPPAQNLPSNYTDQELEQFVKAVSEVMVIQEESQTEMMNAIEENNITVERFNEMLMEGQAQGQENIEASEEELLAFTNSMNEVQTLQMQMQEKMMKAITDNGLDINQYQNIMQSYEVNEEVKNKVDQLFDEYNNER
jgi:uncharacterized iron-regulated protein